MVGVGPVGITHNIVGTFPKILSLLTVVLGILSSFF